MPLLWFKVSGMKSLHWASFRAEPLEKLCRSIGIRTPFLNFADGTGYPWPDVRLLIPPASSKCMVIFRPRHFPQCIACWRKSDDCEEREYVWDSKPEVKSYSASLTRRESRRIGADVRKWKGLDDSANSVSRSDIFSFQFDRGDSAHQHSFRQFGIPYVLASIWVKPRALSWRRSMTVLSKCTSHLCLMEWEFERGHSCQQARKQNWRNLTLRATSRPFRKDSSKT